MYSSALASNSNVYIRVDYGSSYYYEAIEVNVFLSGFYTLSSGSIVNTYGYIYKKKFNPVNPSENLLLGNDDSCGSHHFKLTAVLQNNTTYVLVVTTYYPNVIGNFSIITSGPNNVSFNRISEYLHYYMNTRHRSLK
jgi:hypothetical protein